MRKTALLIVCLLCAMTAYSQKDSVGIYIVRSDTTYRAEMIKPIYTTVTTVVVAGKAKMRFRDVTSKNLFDGSATFRVYYAKPTLKTAVKYYMFDTSYSIKDLCVAQLSVKKKNRDLVSTSITVFDGTLIHAKDAEDLIINTKQLRENVFEITITGPAGEYCILPLVYGMSGGLASVVDFTLR